MVLTPPQDKRPSQARRLTRAALLTAIALTIFLAEAQLPPPVPIPGIKLGLANIVTVYAMFVLGPRDTLLILLSRIFLGAVFSGQMMTLLYSLGGGLLSYLALLLLRRVLGRGQLWVSSPPVRRMPQPGPAAGRRRHRQELGGAGLSPLSGAGRAHYRHPHRPVRPTGGGPPVPELISFPPVFVQFPFLFLISVLS